MISQKDVDSQIQSYSDFPSKHITEKAEVLRESQCSQVQYFDKLGDPNNEFVNLLLTANTKQYCAILQLPFYYQNINEIHFNQSTGESSPSNQSSKMLDIKVEEPLKSELREPEKQQQQNLELNNQEGEKQYLQIFETHNRKNPRIGQSYQVNEVPLITDIVDFQYLSDLEAIKVNQSTLMWDPSNIEEQKLNYYLSNIEKVWPHEFFHYQEEIALYYLHLKNYDVELALTTILFNVDELIRLLLALKKKQRRQGQLTNFLLQQSQKNQGNRVLRERKVQVVDTEDISEEKMEFY